MAKDTYNMLSIANSSEDQYKIEYQNSTSDFICCEIIKISIVNKKDNKDSNFNSFQSN